MHLPDNEHVTRYVREQFILYPKKFGVLGAYSQEALEAYFSLERDYDRIILRLSTEILSGRTISETPEITMTYPASWWQHLKSTVQDWVTRTFGYKRFLRVLLLPLIWAAGFFLLKCPVRFSEMKAQVSFSQEVLYPEAGAIAPPQFGRPVIYETMNVIPAGEEEGSHWATSLSAYYPSRFMDRQEIVNAIYRDTASVPVYTGDANPLGVLMWLEQHGVNVDQLVKRYR